MNRANNIQTRDVYSSLTDVRGLSKEAITGAGKTKPFLLSALILGFYIFTILAFSYQGESFRYSNFSGYLLVLVYFAELTRADTSNRKVIIPGEMVPLVLFVLWAAIGTFWAPDFAKATTRLRTLAQLLMLLVVTFNILHARRDIRPVIYGIVLGTLWAIWQSLLRNNFDLFRQHTADFSREASTLVNANLYAIHLNLAILFLLMVFFNVKELLFRLALSLIIIISATQIFFYTGSRKGIIGLLFIAFVFLGLRYSLDRHHLPKLFGLLVLAVIISQNYAFLLEQTPYADRFVKIENDSSILRRVSLIEEGVDLWMEKPISGYGLNQYRVVSGFGQYAHNNYIEILVNNGLIGFSLYYSTLFVLLIRYWKRLRKGELESIEAAFGIAIILWLFLFDTALVSYSTKTYWLLFALAINGVNSPSGMTSSRVNT